MQGEDGRVASHRALAARFAVDSPRGGRLSFLAVVVVGLAVSVGAWRLEVGRADRALGRGIHDGATSRALNLERRLAVTLEAVSALAAFDAASERVTRDEFATFTGAILVRHPAILALEWIPRVLDGERTEHERLGRAEGLADYQIVERGPSGALIPAQTRAEYCPVFFAEPIDRNQAALGFDLCSEETRALALEEAQATRTLVLTGPTQLVQGAASERSILFCVSVFRPDPTGVEGHRGAYVGVARMADVVRAARGGVGPEPFGLTIYDRTESPGELLYQDGQVADPSAAAATFDAGHSFSTYLTVAGRRWELVFWPTREYVATRQSESPWFVLAGCLLTTIALAKYVSLRMRVESRLRHVAFHDHLTGLPNRALFISRLGQMQAALHSGKGQAYTVLFIDLDGFKLVNDSLGHSVGDELLVAMAGRLNNCLRPHDLVARMGGDEFTVLLEGVDDPAEARAFAQRIQAAIRAPFGGAAGLAVTTCSIGIATHSAVGIVRDLLRDSDIAMYRAKTAGRSQTVVFDESMRIEAIRRQRLELDLRQAINREEIEVVFQPIVSLATGELAGFEALARWSHPQLGPIAPLSFISLAEETGLISQLGGQVLARALDQAYLWHDWRAGRGLAPVGMQVNISSVQLASAETLEELDSRLRAHALPPETVTLELTESILLEDRSHIIDFLEGVRRVGMRVCIDDFGTGYSSLSYLHRLPVDALKIDRSFVSSIDSSDDASGLVQTILLLAHHLGITVTAEGVETAAQVAALLRLDCDYAQGFHYSLPLAAAAATALVESGEAPSSGAVRI